MKYLEEDVIHDYMFGGVAISATMVSRFVQHIQECCNTIVEEHPNLVYSTIDTNISHMMAQFIPNTSQFVAEHQ